MKSELTKINKRLIEILGPKRAFFGRVNTWGQKPDEYEYIGYKLSQNILPTLETMSEVQLSNLQRVMNYFEMHAHSLKHMLTSEDKFYLDDFFSSQSWSQFMTIVMFGMLEVATKIQDWAQFDKKGLLSPKGEQVKRFLGENLSDKAKESIFEKYSPDELFGYDKRIENFGDVVDHLWFEVRSGFVHDASIQAIEMEPYKINGTGSKEDPITFKSQVTVHELLKATWEAILKSYGYKGNLE